MPSPLVGVGFHEAGVESKHTVAPKFDGENHFLVKKPVISEPLAKAISVRDDNGQAALRLTLAAPWGRCTS